MQRFFVSEELIQNDQVLFPADLAHQISRVLRLREGEHVVVLDNSGLERVVELHSFSKRAVLGTVLDTRPNANEPTIVLSLYMALPKGKKMEIVLQKGTELGVTRFVPVLSRRSVTGSLRDLSEAKLDRWENIVREAAEQSERGRLPELVEPQLFEVALEDARISQGFSLLAWEEEESRSLKEVLGLLPRTDKPEINIFIGPEGGFEPDEVLNARAYGVIPVSLGPRILRTETAAVATTAAIMYELGQWSR